MRPAAEQLAEVLSGISFNAPSIPVINNVDVIAAESEADIRDAENSERTLLTQLETVPDLNSSGLELEGSDNKESLQLELRQQLRRIPDLMVKYTWNDKGAQPREDAPGKQTETPQAQQLSTQ